MFTKLFSITILSLSACQVHSCVSMSFHAGNFQSIGEIRRSVPVDGSTKWISIENHVGTIRVTGSPSSMIELVAKVEVDSSIAEKAGAASFEREILVRNEGGTLRLRNAHLDAADSNQWRINWELQLPKSVGVAVQNGVGNVQLESLEGEQNVQLSVGDIESKAAAGAKSALRTGTGNIQFVADRGDFPLQLETGVGDLKLELKQATSQAIECKSGTGGIRIVAPASYSGALDLETGVGKVHLRGASDKKAEPKGAVGASFRGKLGEAQGEIKAKTGVGDIHFTRD